MARIKRSNAATSRRTLAGLGTAGIVVGTIALTAGVGASAAHAATSPALKYTCTASVFGSTIAQGTWTATVSSNLPSQVAPGATLAAPSITAKVTSSTSSTDTLRALGETSVDGTSKASYTVSGAAVNPGARVADLTIPQTKVPASGALTTTASGSGAAEVAASSPGTITVKVGDFTANIQTYKGTTKDLVIPVTCALDSGQDNTLGTITVGAATSTPTSPTSTPTDTGSPTTTATGTSTSTATGTATGTSTSSTDVTGPPIVTDGGSSDNGLNAGVLGGAAIAAAGVGALGVGLRRRLSSKK